MRAVVIVHPGKVGDRREALVGSGVPLGILPGDTGNLLARNLGIRLDLGGAVATAYDGRNRTIDLLDVALGDGQRRVSAVMSGAGWDAEMMAAPEASKRRLGWVRTRSRAPAAWCAPSRCSCASPSTVAPSSQSRAAPS